MADVTTQPMPLPNPIPGSGGTPIAPGLTPGQDWGSIIGAILSGIGAFGKGPTSDIGIGNTAANIANPYGGQYAQWWDQIKAAMQGQGALQSTATGLLNDPTSFLQSKMFTQPLKLGGESLARQFGAAGASNSGNLDAALQDYGQAKAYDFLGQTENMYNAALGNQRGMLQQLMTLGGVTAGSPAAAADAYLKGASARKNDIGGLGAGLGSLLGAILGAPGDALGKLLKLITSGGSNDPFSSSNLSTPSSPGDIATGDSGDMPDIPIGGGDVTTGGDWTGGFDLPGGGDIPSWVSGFDLG